MEINIEVILEKTEGFLYDFLESSTEFLTEGQKKEYQVHYLHNRKEYILKGELRDGKKDGKAVMEYMGIACFELNFKNGKLTGPVKEFDDRGEVKLIGQLVNGVESGVFEEYDQHKEVVWRGYYRNGKRYSKVIESKRTEGYYDEISERSGELLTTSQYDESIRYKNGTCLEYENGIVKRSCVYENEKKIQENSVLHEPMNGMIDYYKEYDNYGRVCTICECNEDYERNGTCYDIQNGVVKQMSYYQDGDLFQVYQSFNGDEMTEYNDNGEFVYIGEYAGDLLRGFYKHGKGKDCQHGKIQYSGSFISGKREGFGIEFKSGQPVFRGSWRNGRRNGREEVKSGVVIWVDGKIKKDYLKSIQPVTLTSTSQALNVLNNQFNRMENLCLYGFMSLKTITIGCECFQAVSRFDLIGLDSLEKVVIERNCFYKHNDGGTVKPEGECCILDCPRLLTIRIGDSCFNNYTSIHLADLPALQTLELGQNCFYHTTSFFLFGPFSRCASSADLPCLQSVSLDAYCLSLVHQVLFGSNQAA